jgi:hypothetical protein
MLSEEQIRDLIKQPMRPGPRASSRIETLEEVLQDGYLGDGYWQSGRDDGDPDASGL